MTLDDDFTDAQARVQKLAQRPSQDELLTLYALFKQATVGDVTGRRPGLLDLKGRAKFDAWQRRKGRSSDACQQEYAKLVERLEHKYGTR
jgi:diazepam-binding inhibitor (GABA receptor modulating acyl-CoA-binding protein)